MIIYLLQYKCKGYFVENALFCPQIFVDMWITFAIVDKFARTRIHHDDDDHHLSYIIYNHIHNHNHIHIQLILLFSI